MPNELPKQPTPNGPFYAVEVHYHPGHEHGLLSCCVEGFMAAQAGSDEGLGLFVGTTKEEAERKIYLMNFGYAQGRQSLEGELKVANDQWQGWKERANKLEAEVERLREIICDASSENGNIEYQRRAEKLIYTRKERQG